MGGASLSGGEGVMDCLGHTQGTMSLSVEGDKVGRRLCTESGGHSMGAGGLRDPEQRASILTRGQAG